MEERKLNMEVEQAEKPVPTFRETEVLKRMYSYHDGRSIYQSQINEYVRDLFECIQDGVNLIADDEYGAETMDVIKEGYRWIDEPYDDEDPDFISNHISKDLWKGFVLGFQRGHSEACYKD